MINTLFYIGDVVIETAGKAGKLTFSRVENPKEVQREIFERMDKRRQQKAQEDAERRRGEISEWFDVYHETFVGLED